ncbi:MAG: NAD-dependent succinate-semialdehyde dehydrogenase [Candidatus Eremiobacteraeota bacterium]|nr:NAD-dependent succinate-semialdehyde dehydrogenase [Candidatus Eremiobacteraeota bacterium]
MTTTQARANTFETIDPSNGGRLELLEYTSQAELDASLDHAVAAQRSWRTSSFAQRGTLFTSVARVLRDGSNDYARTIVREMGKPIAQARAEVEKCAATCEYFAAHAARFLADEPVESNATQSYVAFRPLGVVLAVMPWNFPFWQLFRAAAPAMMAGNAMVLKHSSNVSRCALEMEEIFKRAGAPVGLFRTILVAGSNVAPIIADERIAAVTLTGSEGTGVAVASTAGKHLKKSVLELGGSDPFIVLADARIEDAVKFAVRARFQNNGQSCIAAKRFIVEARRYDEFVERFAKASSEQIVGNPMEDATQIGPMARDDLRGDLRKLLDESKAKGARIATGGGAIDRKGFYFEPTVVADVDDTMPVFREETFGPVAAVVRANDAEHAVALANDSKYGLGANVWTENIARAKEMATRIESGLVFINGMVASDARLPFGGVKKSGFGRELSSFGIREFVNVQTVWVGPERVPTKGADAE